MFWATIFPRILGFLILISFCFIFILWLIIKFADLYEDWWIKKEKSLPSEEEIADMLQGLYYYMHDRITPEEQTRYIGELAKKLHKRIHGKPDSQDSGSNAPLRSKELKIKRRLGCNLERH